MVETEYLQGKSQNAIRSEKNFYKVNKFILKRGFHKNTYQCHITASIKNKDKIYGMYSIYTLKFRKPLLCYVSKFNQNAQ